MITRAFVQYCFDSEEHSVSVRPHGNSKKKEKFLRTMPSTIKKLKMAARNLTPKFAVCEVSSAVGGIMTAPSAGTILRNRLQVSNLRRRSDGTNDCNIKKKDALFSVMLMCKDCDGSGTEDPFIRLVSGAPEPMTVLSFDWLLQDVDRFCGGEEHTILSVDPTFNLGDFDVTVTMYRHLMLINSHGSHPVMIGPMFIHQRKKFESYYFFASSLVGLHPSMRNLQAFGTNGEKALANALHTVFNKAVHVRCFLHFKGNLDSRLQDLGIPKHERIEFLRDVFGNPLQLEDGLVDVDDDSFEVAVKNLELVWNTRERVFNDPPPPPPPPPPPSFMTGL